MGDGSAFQVAEGAPSHYQEQVARFMLPISAALVSAVVNRGDTVLDVACGTGIATRLAALAVGSSGKVVGSDLNQGMLDFAKSISAEEWPQIAWEQASALDLPYEPRTFDRVICQQGVQFFPHPAAGLREMGRVAKPGGSVAVTVWSELSTSPYFEALVEMLIDFAGVELAEISFSATEPQIIEWFSEAHLPTPNVQLIEQEVELPLMSEYLTSHMKALPWAPAYFDLDDSTKTAAIAHVENRLREYQTPTGVRTHFGSYLAHVNI